MPEIIIDGKTFSYTINRKPIRSLRLHLNSDSSFTVSCPRLTPALIVTGFVKAHSSWIIKTSLKVHRKIRIQDLTHINILDSTYQIFFGLTTKDSVVINSIDKKIYLYSPQSLDSHLRSLLEAHLRPLALSLIQKEIKQLSQRFGFEHGRISVRNQKTRFGSCSSRGTLSFNWQIIFFPQDKFRHILLHELTHLKIKNHSRRFWDQLAVYDPACKFNNVWLRKEGTKLFLISS